MCEVLAYFPPNKKFCTNLPMKIFLFVTNISYNRVTVDSTSSIGFNVVGLNMQKA
jgi:hypothetical protein